MQDDSGNVYRLLTDVSTSADGVPEAIHLFASPCCDKRELVVFRHNNEYFITCHKWSSWRHAQSPDDQILENAVRLRYLTSMRQSSKVKLNHRTGFRLVQMMMMMMMMKTLVMLPRWSYRQWWRAIQQKRHRPKEEEKWSKVQVSVPWTLFGKGVARK